MNEGVEVVGHKALKVRARVPLSTTLLLTHAGDDTPAPSHTVTRKVRLGGTIRHQVIENILGTADIEGTNRPHEVGGDVWRPVVDGGSGVQQGGEGQDMRDFAEINLTEVHAVHRERCGEPGPACGARVIHVS